MRARAEPRPGFSPRLFWEDSASISNPLAVTRAYAARFAALGGLLINADARSLHRSGGRWRVDTAQGQLDGDEAVVALGPFAPDVLRPLGITLPLGIKRGYHRHYRANGNAGLTRPVVDLDLGYCLAPMEQGIRLTTGAEFAARDAPPTPVQFDRLFPQQGNFSRSESRWRRPPGWAAGPAFRIRARSWDALRNIPACGLPTAMPIGA